MKALQCPDLTIFISETIRKQGGSIFIIDSKDYTSKEDIKQSLSHLLFYSRSERNILVERNRMIRSRPSFIYILLLQIWEDYSSWKVKGPQSRILHAKALLHARACLHREEVRHSRSLQGSMPPVPPHLGLLTMLSIPPCLARCNASFPRSRASLPLPRVLCPCPAY